MKNTLETRLGIFFALALIAAFLIMEMMGSVEKIELLQDKVDVTMKLNMPDNVRTDSKAIVKFAGLMGQNFVEIRFGSATAPRADNHTLIKSEEQPDLSMLMARLDKVASGIERATESISGESFEKLLAPLTDFVKENSPRLTAILSNIKTISTQIAEGKGTLGKLAKDDALYKETTIALTNLREILQKINQGQGSVGKLVNDESLYKNAKLSLQKLDKATEGLEDQGPLSVLGIAVNSLF